MSVVVIATGLTTTHYPDITLVTTKRCGHYTFNEGAYYDQQIVVVNDH